MVVGLNSLSSNTDGVTIYPNPSTGTFNIKASGLEGQRSEVKITDLLGQVIYNDDAVPVSMGSLTLPSPYMISPPECISLRYFPVELRIR